MATASVCLAETCLMRRADRLFRIIQYLRGGRLVTARGLSHKLEVCERTIYRDMADLQASGVPIDGAAGVGYIMRKGFDLPPLMFSREEIVALVTGIRLVEAWGGSSMLTSAREALVKIEAVVPDDLRDRMARIAVYAPDFMMSEVDRIHVDEIENAVAARCVVALRYLDAQDKASDRTVWPLGLVFWGKVWTLVAWCELREDFRTFRIDRMQRVDVLERHFRARKGRTMADFMSRLCIQD